MNLMQNPIASWNSVIAQLYSAWDKSRFPQVLLLEGIPGIGKRKLAMDLAAFITCESDETPCGVCFSCRKAIDPGSVQNWVVPLETKDRETVNKVAEATQEVLRAQLENPYDLQLAPAVAIIGVEQIRHLRDQTHLKADKNRVFIVTDADRMNTNAANALLKTLEEVPSQTYFILTTSARHKMLPTILSRSLPMVLPALSDAEIKGIFKERKLADPSPEILGLAQGSVGRAMQCAQMDFPVILERAQNFLTRLDNAEWSPMILELDSWAAKDLEISLFHLEVLATLLQDLQRAKAGLPLRFPSLKGFQFKSGSPDSIHKMVSLCAQAATRLVQRKGVPNVVLPALALQLGEVCNVR